MKMKALTTLRQERTAREESSIIGLPKVGYSTALTSWFLLGDGSIYQVESCAPFYFLLYVLACTLEWPARERQELLGLAGTYDEEEWNLNRWYVLDTLKERKLHAPLFDSADEAYACVKLLQWMRHIKEHFPLTEESESDERTFDRCTAGAEEKTRGKAYEPRLTETALAAYMDQS